MSVWVCACSVSCPSTFTDRACPYLMSKYGGNINNTIWTYFKQNPLCVCVFVGWVHKHRQYGTYFCTVSLGITCTPDLLESMCWPQECVLPLHSSHSPTEHVHTYKNVSVSQYGGNINNTFLEQKPTPCVFVRWVQKVNLKENFESDTPNKNIDVQLW